MALALLIDKITIKLLIKTNMDFFCILLEFDIVNHNIITPSLEHYKIRGDILKWIQRYLVNRMPTVTFYGTNSVFSRVRCGIPQG